MLVIEIKVIILPTKITYKTLPHTHQIPDNRAQANWFINQKQIRRKQSNRSQQKSTSILGECNPSFCFSIATTRIAPRKNWIEFCCWISFLRMCFMVTAQTHFHSVQLQRKTMQKYADESTNRMVLIHTHKVNESVRLMLAWTLKHARLYDTEYVTVIAVMCEAFVLCVTVYACLSSVSFSLASFMFDRAHVPSSFALTVDLLTIEYNACDNRRFDAKQNYWTFVGHAPGQWQQTPNPFEQSNRGFHSTVCPISIYDYQNWWIFRLRPFKRQPKWCKFVRE